jgi:hypothetical protein
MTTDIKFTKNKNGISELTFIKKNNMKNCNPELYHKNYVALAEAIMNSGGNPFTVMKKYEELLIVLSNNDINLNPVYIRPNDEIEEPVFLRAV